VTHGLSAAAKPRNIAFPYATLTGLTPAHFLEPPMDDIVVWIIIAAFYAPLHYLLPVLILFITGREPEQARRGMIRRALIDSTLSMAVAFAVVIVLVQQGWISLAMLILLLSMGIPFIRIWRHRREMLATTD
jgi:hypothetical protein